MPTDARLPSDWLNTMRFDNLSDTSWRVFTSALMWSAGNGTDGIIPNRYLKMLHPDGTQVLALKEIEQAKLWTRTEDGYVLDDWDGALGQSTAAQVETYRANARDRQRKHREKNRQTLAKKVGFTDPVTSDVTRDVTDGITRDVGKGTGEGAGIEAKEVEVKAEDFEPKPAPVTDLPDSVPAASERPGWVKEGNRWSRVKSA